MRHRVLLPPSQWAALEALAERYGRTVQDVFVASALVALEDPDYIAHLTRVARDMFRPLAKWPTDPIDALLVCWILMDCRIRL